MTARLWRLQSIWNNLSLLILPVKRRHTAFIFFSKIPSRPEEALGVFRGRRKENIENPTLSGLLCVLAHFAVVFPRSLVSGVRAARRPVDGSCTAHGKLKVFAPPCVFKKIATLLPFFDDIANI